MKLNDAGRFNLRGKRPLIASSVFIALAGPLPAHASLLWDWSYTGAGIAASGTFTTDNALGSGGYYEIMGITGSRNGVAITSLEPAGDAIPGNPGFPVDNLITASGLLTSHGFGFATAEGNYANPYYADFLAIPVFFEVFTEPASMGFSELPVEFTAAIVREPGTAALVLAALVGLVAVGRGRRDHRLGDAIPGSNRVGVLPQTTPRSHRKRTMVDRAEAWRKIARLRGGLRADRPI